MAAAGARVRHPEVVQALRGQGKSVNRGRRHVAEGRGWREEGGCRDEVQLVLSCCRLARVGPCSGA